MEENKQISDLFERARNEAPKTSFEEMKKHVLSTGAVGGVGIIAKWAAASFKFKAIVMIAILSTLTVSGILIITQLANPTGTAAKKQENGIIHTEQNFEILSEDGVQKMTIYDENDKVVQVIVDSSENVKHKDQAVNLSVKELELLTASDNTSNSRVVMYDETSKRGIVANPLKERKFTITQNTTSEELKNIMKQARDAGIDFGYETRVRKGVIKKITMSMIIKAESGTSEWHSKISGSKSFSFKFGWNENDFGKAISFISSCDRIIGVERPEIPEAPKRPEVPEKR